MRVKRQQSNKQATSTHRFCMRRAQAHKRLNFAQFTIRQDEDTYAVCSCGACFSPVTLGHLKYYTMRNPGIPHTHILRSLSNSTLVAISIFRATRKFPAQSSKTCLSYKYVLSRSSSDLAFLVLGVLNNQDNVIGNHETLNLEA